jgi:hypothetical protein
VSATETLALALAAGVRVRTDGDDLLLEASAPPPPAVLDLVSRHKTDIIALLRSSIPEPPRTPQPIPQLPPMAELTTPDCERGDAAQAATVAGLLVAARRRPPSWADPAAPPSRGCSCSCCKGQGWWRERDTPKGWRCSTCHPPDHLPKNAVTEVRT